MSTLAMIETLSLSSPNVNIFVAFAAGLASFLSPCVLPLVPGYLSYMSGLSVVELKSGELQAGQMRRVLTATLAFVLGISLTLIAFYSVVNYVLQDLLIEYNTIFNTIMGLIVIVFGLQIAGLFRFSFLNQERRFHLDSGKARGPVGAFLLGIAFAFGWSPCVGPALAAIITLANDTGSQGNAASGIVLMVVYVLGLGLPFLAAGLAINVFLKFSMRLRSHFRLVEIASGGLLVLIGLLIISGNFKDVAAFFSRFTGG